MENDLTKKNIIGGIVEFLNVVGATWGFVTLGVIVLIVGWNVYGGIYAKLKNYSSEMEVMERRLEKKVKKSVWNLIYLHSLQQ
jgi:hypothetical protein